MSGWDSPLHSVCVSWQKSTWTPELWLLRHAEHGQMGLNPNPTPIWDNVAMGFAAPSLCLSFLMRQCPCLKREISEFKTQFVSLVEFDTLTHMPMTQIELSYNVSNFVRLMNWVLQIVWGPRIKSQIMRSWVTVGEVKTWHDGGYWEFFQLDSEITVPKGMTLELMTMGLVKLKLF